MPSLPGIALRFAPVDAELARHCSLVESKSVPSELGTYKGNDAGSILSCAAPRAKLLLRRRLARRHQLALRDHAAVDGAEHFLAGGAFLEIEHRVERQHLEVVVVRAI